MKYGYTRVSADGQNPGIQLAAVSKSERKTIFKDELSGATIKRPALLRCLKKL